MAGPIFHEESTNNSNIMEVLASEGVQFLLSGEAEKVPLSSIDGKTICLFFSANWCRPCKSFAPQLVQLYNKLRKNGKNIEIIFISFDRDENGFNEHFKCMPWLAVPFDDSSLHRRLRERYRVDRIPSFFPLSVVDGDGDGDGDGDEDDLVEELEDYIGLIEDYGAQSFPFTKKRREELKAIDNAKLQGGKLEELLACEDGNNCLISRDGRKILVSELLGKTIGLYFGAHWCPPCRAFTTQLIQTYDELMITSNKYNNPKFEQCFEIILVSTDRDQEEFDLNLRDMPWLAIPFQSRTRQELCRIFNIQGIPALILIGEDGKTITNNGRAMISLYGAKAFPFNVLRISELQVELKKEGDGLPHQVKDPRHEHVLKLDMAKAYVCDSCKKQGRFWAFSCDVCDYDLHPTCLEKNTH